MFAKAPILLLNYTSKDSWNLISLLKLQEFSTSTGRNYFAKTTLDLKNLKQISKQSGIKINAICISLLISTLKKTLKKVGKDTNGQNTDDDASIFYPLPNALHPADKGQFGSYA